MRKVEIDGELYIPADCPKSRVLESHCYCSRDDGATLELKMRFETQPERDKAFAVILRLFERAA